MKLKTDEISLFLSETGAPMQKSWKEFAKAALQSSPPHFRFVYEQLTQEVRHFTENLEASSLDAAKKNELQDLIARFIEVKEVLFTKGSLRVALKFGAKEGEYNSQLDAYEKEIVSFTEKGDFLLKALLSPYL